MSKLLLLLCCLGLLLHNAFGQAIGDYRSFATGSWNNVNTWERFNGIIWINPAPATPTNSDGIITIMAFHTVNVPSGPSVTADQIEFDNTNPGNTGILIVDFGGTLIINNGAGNDVRLLNDFTTVALLQVSGTLQLNTGATLVDDDYGNLSIGPGPVTNATYSILNGGVHIHTTGASVDMIPAADWQSGSTCQVNATSGTVPSISSTIAFHHFIWNGGSQTVLLNLNAGLRNINGDFTISSTNAQILQLSQVTSYTLSIGRDFLIQNNSRVQFATTANPVIINVNRDFNISSTNATANTIAFNATGSTTLNVTGNFSKSGASILSMVLGTSGTDILNLNGDFSITGGTITRNSTVGSATATVNFNGASTKTFTNSGTILNAISFVIANGKTLNFGTSSMTGSGSFTLQAGATMGVGSVDGLNIAGTALGNIKVTGTRTYTALGNIVYNGSGAQNLGNEWDVTGALSGVAVNLEIASSGTVTDNVNGSTSVVGKFTLTSGSFAIGDANTLQVQGNFAGNGGTIIGFSGSTSNLTFSGAGTTTGNLTFAGGGQLLNNFTISRGGTILLTTPLTVSGILAFTSTGNLQFNAQTLTVNGDITQSGSGGLISTVTTSNLVIGGTGPLSALPYTGAMQLNNVTLGRTGGGAYTWNNAASVNGTLDLNSGTLTHSSGLTMVTGSTFSRSAGTTYSGGSPTPSSSYNVNYSGALTTSNELPVSASALNNLTVAGNATLSNAITVNGNLTINSGTLDANTRNVTMAGASFTVNGGAFTINAANTVTFSRAGITTLGGATVGGTQFGNFVINLGATLSAPNANINVSGTWTNGGSFTANTGTVTFNGAGQNIAPSGQPFNNVDFAGTGTKILQGQLDVNGALTISSTLDVGANRPINVAGSWTNNGTFVAGGGTVTFNGASQTISPNGQSFFNLTLATSGTKTLASAITIGGALTINNPVTFDVSASAYAVNIAGNWINNGTFTRQTGTVTFSNTTAISGTGSASFHHVTTTGVLTAPSGAMDVSGNWLQSSGSFAHNSGTLQFSGNAQSITPGAQTFNNVTFSGTNTKTLLGSTVVNGVLTLTAGTFDTNANALDLKGNFVSNSTSVLTSNTVTFSGATALSGATTPTFGNVTITGSLTPSSSFNVNGNLVNNGTLTASAGTTTFGGNTTISGSSVCSFNNVTISNILTASSGTLNVAGNWTNNGTFNASSGTTVFNGTTSIAGSSSTNFANITISGTLNGPATLNVGGNFANSGTFNRGTGTVVFNGSATQSISGSAVTDFNNITVSNNINSPAVQVQSNQNLRGVLTLSGTSTVFDADGSGNTSIFKVMSTADNPTVDASIATLPAGTSVSGNVTVQRHMSIEGANSTRIYRYISSPVSGAPVSQLQAFIPVTGTFTGASACSGCGTSQSMFTYDETVITGDLNTGYTNFPVSANSETFAPGVGYTVFVRGNINPVSGAGSALWELRGPINAGNKTLPVSFTSSGIPANDGWNMVGNPYPSTIDWQAAGWTKNNVNDALYVLDNGLGVPVYATFIGGVGANGGSRYIPAGQAFFVKVNAGPALAVTEAVKSAGTQTTFFRTTTIPDYVRVTLRQGTVADESVIRFTEGATAGFDTQWDALKLKNPSTFNLSSLAGDNTKLAINSMPVMAACIASVKMDVSNATAGSYSLDFTEFDSFTDVGMKISLLDAFTSQTVDVRAASLYPFQVTTNPASFGSDRFTLTFGESLSSITALGGSRCGEGTVDIHASGASEGNYRWYTTMAGGSPIGGATASTFTTPSIDRTKTYYVAPATSSGCEGTRIAVVATVTILEPVTITENGKNLVSSYAVGNQWYLNGQLISGATTQSILPVLPGVYKVEVTSSNCSISAERVFVVTGLEENLPSHITIYPNPTSSVLTVAVESSNEVNARLLTLLGTTLYTQPLVGGSVKRASFNLEDNADGMYILIVQDGNQIYKTRIIKKR